MSTNRKNNQIDNSHLLYLLEADKTYLHEDIDFKSQENTPKLEIKALPSYKRYKGLANVQIISGGIDYPFSTSINFPSPEHPDGSQPDATITYGLTYNSINITGGTGIYSGQQFLLYPKTQTSLSEPALLRITDVTPEGSPTNWELLESGSGFSNEGFDVIDTYQSFNYKYRLESDSNNIDLQTTASSRLLINFIADKFTITNIDITNFGSGYQMYNLDGLPKFRPVILSSSGSGYGFYAFYDQADKIITEISESNIAYNRKLLARNQNNSFTNNNLIQYKDIFTDTIIKNNITHTDDDISTIASETNTECDTSAISPSNQQNASLSVIVPVALVGSAVVAGLSIGLRKYRENQETRKRNLEIVRKNAIASTRIKELKGILENNIVARNQMLIDLLTVNRQQNSKLPVVAVQRTINLVFGQQYTLGTVDNVIIERPIEFWAQRSKVIEEAAKDIIYAQLDEIDKATYECASIASKYRITPEALKADFDAAIDAAKKKALSDIQTRLGSFTDIKYDIDVDWEGEGDIFRKSKDEALEIFTRNNRIAAERRLIEAHYAAIKKALGETFASFKPRAARTAAEIARDILNAQCSKTSAPKLGSSSATIKVTSADCIKGKKLLGPLAFILTIYQFSQTSSAAERAYLTADIGLDAALGLPKTVFDVASGIDDFKERNYNGLRDEFGGIPGRDQTPMGPTLREKVMSSLELSMSSMIKAYLMGESYKKLSIKYQNLANIALQAGDTQSFERYTALANEANDQSMAYPSKESIRDQLASKVIKTSIDFYNKFAEVLISGGDLYQGGRYKLACQYSDWYSPSYTFDEFLEVLIDETEKCLDDQTDNWFPSQDSLEYIEIIREHELLERIEESLSSELEKINFGSRCEDIEENCTSYCNKKYNSDLRLQLEASGSKEVETGIIIYLNGDMPILDVDGIDPKKFTLGENIILDSKTKNDILRLLNEDSDTCIEDKCCSEEPDGSDSSGSGGSGDSGDSGSYGLPQLQHSYRFDYKTQQWIKY